MTIEEDYKDHDIVAEASPAAGGAFTWSFTIDGQHLRESRERALPTEELALAEALEAARKTIDGWRRLEGR